MNKQKINLILLIIFFSTIFAGAQITAVTATITDSDSIIWINPQWSVQFVPNPNFPNLNSYSINGVPITSNTYSQYIQVSGTGNNAGLISTTLLDNNQILPAGSKYRWVIQSQTSASATTYLPITITGASQALTTVLSASAIAPRFAAINSAFGYADIEISTVPEPGNYYYNVINAVQRLWNGTAWITAGGGVPSGNAGGALAGTYPNPILNTSSPLGLRVASGITTVFDGDSLTAGVGTVGPTTRWPNILLTYPEWTNRTITYINNAVSGQTCSQRVSAYPGQGHLISPAVTGTPGMYFIWVGTNDLVVGTAASTIYNCISGFWSTLKTDGWTVVASTLHGISNLEPSSNFDMLQRQTLNDLIRSAGVTSTTYDYLMDPDTIYRDPHNTVWMQSDGTHPSVAGNAYFASYVNGLIWSHGAVAGTPGSQKDSGLGTGGGNFRTSQWSLYSLTNGVDNTASGIGTLGLCAGCTGVTADGFGAGPSITSGFYDSLFGYGTGNSLTGSASEISAFGYRALAALAINNTNTTSAFGYQAGVSCISCTASLALGGSADLGASVSNATQLGAGQNVQSNTFQWLTLTLESKATFSVSGCGIATSLLGSGLAGQFTGGSVTCTPVVTTGLTAPNGYTCFINDETTSTALFHQTAHNTTTVTFTASGIVGATDVINFGCKEF